MLKRAALLSLTILVVSTGTTCLAKKDQAPLPAQILVAKTVYVENHGSAKIKDKTYDDLKKWGRWTIVEDRTKADLVIVLSSQEGSSSSGRTQTYDPNMKTGTMTTGGWKYGTVTAESSDSTHLELVDSKTGQALYADSKSSMRGIIKELRKRIEEQEKASKDK